MTEHISLAAIVLLLIGGVTVYIAYRDEKLGAALLVAVGAVTVLVLLLGAPRPTEAEQQLPAPQNLYTSPADLAP